MFGTERRARLQSGACSSSQPAFRPISQAARVLARPIHHGHSRDLTAAAPACAGQEPCCSAMRSPSEPSTPPRQQHAAGCSRGPSQRAEGTHLSCQVRRHTCALSRSRRHRTPASHRWPCAASHHLPGCHRRRRDRRCSRTSWSPACRTKSTGRRRPTAPCAWAGRVRPIDSALCSPAPGEDGRPWATSATWECSWAHPPWPHKPAP